MPESRTASQPPEPWAAATMTRSRDAHLVDVTVFFAPTSGGVRRYLLAKHAWLAHQSRFEHTVLVPGDRDAGRAGGVMAFGSPAIPFGRGYRVPLRLREFRERLAQLEPDLVEVGDPYHLAGPSLRVARARGVPTIAFCHSDVIGLAQAVAGEWAARRAARYLTRLYERFDLVLAPSQAVAVRLRRLGLEHVETQPLGVDVRSFHPSARDPGLRMELGIAPHARLLVFAGRLSAEKRVGDLLAAMRRLGPSYHLLLVGHGRAGRLDSNVSLLEYQREPARLARLLASCDAFVHAGDQETFGLVVLEAMACGLPAVVARAGALPEQDDDGIGQTFTPRDPADLARSVERLFERDYRALGRAARRRAETLAWDVAFAGLLGRYDALLRRRAPAPTAPWTEAWRRAG